METEVGNGPNEHGGVAQLGEHLPCTQGVRSSNLLISTRAKPGGRAQGSTGGKGEKPLAEAPKHMGS
jgi:hypothetical protein